MTTQTKHCTPGKKVRAIGRITAGMRSMTLNFPPVMLVFQFLTKKVKLMFIYSTTLATNGPILSANCIYTNTGSLNMTVTSLRW